MNDIKYVGYANLLHSCHSKVTKNSDLFLNVHSSAICVLMEKNYAYICKYMILCVIQAIKAEIHRKGSSFLTASLSYITSLSLHDAIFHHGEVLCLCRLHKLQPVRTQS